LLLYISRVNYFCGGEMAERSNAAVLKTVDCQRSGGSNPSLSAKQKCESLARQQFSEAFSFGARH
jgi:hypothetical protein